MSGGRTETEWTAVEWAQEVAKQGAGEILLTSMNNDGTKVGFALDITAQVSASVNIPVIASGGAGKIEDFKTLFQTTKATAGLAASIFHFGEIGIAELKNELIREGVNIRV